MFHFRPLQLEVDDEVIFLLVYPLYFIRVFRFGPSGGVRDIRGIRFRGRVFGSLVLFPVLLLRRFPPHWFPTMFHLGVAGSPADRSLPGSLLGSERPYPLAHLGVLLLFVIGAALLLDSFRLDSDPVL
jgi:hypothetical protein